MYICKGVTNGEGTKLRVFFRILELFFCAVAGGDHQDFDHLPRSQFDRHERSFQGDRLIPALSVSSSPYQLSVSIDDGEWSGEALGQKGGNRRGPEYVAFGGRFLHGIGGIGLRC